MSISIIKAIPFRVSTDERSSVVMCHATTSSVGEQITRGKGWYGSNGHASTPIDVICIDHDGELYQFDIKSRIHVVSSVQEYTDKANKTKRDALIAKLSDDELALLGLSRI